MKILPDAAEQTVHQVGSLAMDAIDTILASHCSGQHHDIFVHEMCNRGIVHSRQRDSDVCNVISPFAHVEQLQASNRQSIGPGIL
jgi:hypothetical protein